MTSEVIVISDTNIFIDLISVGLLEEFFKLPHKVSTTDFVIGEISNQEQRAQVNSYIANDKLHVESFSVKSLQEIGNLFSERQNNISFTDCSVWYYAKKVNARLLTGDRKLRSVSEDDGIKVSGILYVFRQIVENNVITCKNAAKKLRKLMTINSRLPQKDCKELLDSWE